MGGKIRNRLSKREKKVDFSVKDRREGREGRVKNDQRKQKRLKKEFG